MAAAAVLSRPRQARAKQSTAKITPAKKQGVGIDLQEVARVAYELYDKRGRLDGYDQQDWLEAERIVTQRQRSTKA